MKRFFSVLILLCPVWVTAQPAAGKTGYADIHYILGRLPETKAAEVELASLQQQLTRQLDAKYTVLQAKQGEYVALERTMQEATRAAALRELQLLEKSVQKFQDDAMALLQQKKELLMKPVLIKVHQAAERTAKENGFNLILLQVSDVLYGDPALDITLPVLMRLGIQLSADDVRQYNLSKSNGLYGWLEGGGKPGSQTSE